MLIFNLESSLPAPTVIIGPEEFADMISISESGGVDRRIEYPEHAWASASSDELNVWIWIGYVKFSGS